MSAEESGDLYNYLTPEVVAQFDGAGSESLVQLLSPKSEPNSEALEVSSEIFTELLMALQDEQLETAQVIGFLGNAIQAEESAELFCQILTVFPWSERLQHFLAELNTQGKVIKQKTLYRNVSGDYLARCGIVPGDALTRQLNTRRRDHFYTQKKFNLLHEETEGFARLTVEVYDFLKFEDSSYKVSYVLDVVESIIGHYSLDPNKCLDVLLDCFFNNLIGKQDAIIAFLKASRWWPSTPADNSCLDNLSVGGNENAGKLLGLKFLKYPVKNDVPETLKLLVAILIKEGFVSFGSFYEFLNRSPTEMDDLEKLYKKDLEDRVFKSNANALALAAPLLDDEDGDSAKEQSASKIEKKEQTIESSLSSNFRYQMLRTCLSVGLYWPSVYILTEFPFLAKVDPEINELICRLYHEMIKPLYSTISEFTPEEFEILQKGRPVAVGKPYNAVSLSEFPCTTFLTFKATINSYSMKKFVFFYSTWAKDLPPITSMDELFLNTRGLLKFIDVNLAKDSVLFSKICDLVRKHIDQNRDNETVMTECFQYFRHVIFPAISLIEDNSIAVDKAYGILSCYPKEDRFNLYSELHQVLSKNNPLIKISYGKAEKSTKDVLKRLSKETVKPMMRRIAKISFSNPLPCFLTALQQIESYDNLNSLVVETARYFNGYGWDVLTLAILMRLTAPGRSNTQDDGLHERQWIQSLSSFIGKICQRYPNAIDVGTLIEYLLKSLHSNDTVGLIVLKEIFISMGGMQPISDLTLEQINRINCGGTLEKLVYFTINDLRYERSKSGELLVKTLCDLDCINELLVLLCQASDGLVFDSADRPLKVLSNRKDDLTTVIQLFTNVVSFFYQEKDVANHLASIEDLVTVYKVPPEWAYEIWRIFLDKTDTSAIKQLIEKVKTDQENSPWDFLSSELYGTYWSLSLYDINCPEELYDQTEQKYKDTIPGLELTYSKTKRSKTATRAEVDQSKKDLDQAKEYAESLPLNKESHSLHTTAITQKISDDSSEWFKDSGSISSFLQLCILPRAVHSAYDAVYAAKFLFKLSTCSVSNFNLMVALEELLSRSLIIGSIFSSTPMEAENLGMFFAEILSSLHHWRQEGTFNSNLKDAKGLSLDLKSFRAALFSYHDQLFKGISEALSTTEYMCRRNAITFLRSLLGVYPTVEDHCEEIVELIDNIVQNESREDLKLSASALIGHIRSRSKEWEHMWDFMEMEEEAKTQQVNKRKEIEEARAKKIAEAKRIQEEERLAREKKEKEELELKLKKEKEAQELEKLKENEKKGLTYSEGKGGSRPDSRATKPARDRVDYYSAYEKSKDPGDDTEKSDDKKTIKSESPTKPDSKKEDTQEKSVKDDDTMEVDSDIKKDETVDDKENKKDDKKEEPEKKSKVADSLKTRIKAAKEELNNERNKASSQPKPLGPSESKPFDKHQSRSSTPSQPRSSAPNQSRYSAPSQPRSSTPNQPRSSTPNQPRSSTPSQPRSSTPNQRYSQSQPRYQSQGYSNDDKGGRARAPLPPQSSVARDVSTRPYQKPGYASSHRPNTPSAQHAPDRGLPPPPPPPPPPPVGGKPRPDNKRKYEGNNNGRSYDKRQRY